ncbi:DUF4157 domain-containing protein [Streptomyces boncukensis]|uniref:DUF4157 domain-containing protein n=1 Tax=Streptomyces boncukensis TaxID=2711219 RepID=A0A6G4WX61_9ACTN|nr:DUF4157 domain-containing protein [Streptomyces boncukensis]NGO69698.1 DUF4157 domain-containing protein [Streptomyces boncukensis]
MHAHEERPGEKAASTARTPRPAEAGPGAGVRGPLTPAAVTALQRSVGNRAVARLLDEDQHVHGAGCGHDHAGAEAASGAELVDEATKSPGRQIPDPLLGKLESFYQNKSLSAARLHDNAVAQRALSAMGAQAMTLGAHVFLPPGGLQRADLVGHEGSHLNQNLRNVPETGSITIDGVNLTDPNQRSERMADTDGSAFAAGAKTAPSLQAQGLAEDAEAE